MSKPPFNLYIFLLLAAAYSLLWGRIMFINANRNYTARFCLFIMRFSRAKQRDIHSLFLGIIYLLTGLLGSLIFSIIFKINILKYFALQEDFFIFIFVGIFAEMSIANMLMLMLGSLTPHINYQKEISSIKWIKEVFKLPRFLIPLAPTLGGFFEELFFRGVLLIILLRFYPAIGFLAAIAIVTVLFALQQGIQTNSFPQAGAMALASLAISGIGSLLVIHTGSILPAVIAHCSFIIFYFKGMGFSREYEIERPGSGM